MRRRQRVGGGRGFALARPDDDAHADEGTVRGDPSGGDSGGSGSGGGCLGGDRVVNAHERLRREVAVEGRVGGVEARLIGHVCRLQRVSGERRREHANTLTRGTREHASDNDDDDADRTQIHGKKDDIILQKQRTDGAK